MGSEWPGVLGGEVVGGGVEVDGGGAVGGEVAKALDEGLGAVGFELLGSATAQVGVGWRGAERGARQQGLDVDAGAADADRNFSAGLDSSAGDACRPGRAEDLSWAIYVNQMVGYAFSFGDWWRGGADVESAVELAGGGMTRWVELPRRRGWARRTPHRRSEEPGSAQISPVSTSDSGWLG